MARRTGMSPSTVHRIWAELGDKPHRTETFKFSTDPDLAAKVRDVVGLYLDPPAGAVVLGVDEKTQIQALDRTQPQLPMRPGQVERHTHESTRNGPPVANPVRGARGRPGCRHHDHPRTAHRGRLPRLPAARGARLSGRRAARRPRGRLHPQDARRPRLAGAPSPDHLALQPDLGVRMNQVETWFGILTRAAIRRGSFRSVRELVAMIDAFTRQWNDGSSPFTWVKTADEILAKAVRKPRATNEPGH
jgi:hypothetical protein